MVLNKLVLLGVFVVLGNCNDIRKRRYDVDPYTEDDLPKIYHMENYHECMQNYGKFCKMEVYITPRDKKCKLAVEIQKSKNNVMRYDRSKLERMKCFLPNTTLVEHLREDSRRRLDKELGKFKVDYRIENLRCGQKDLDNLDFFMMFILALYCVLVFMSTKYDLNENKETNGRVQEFKYSKLYEIFSVKRNWQKVFTENSSVNFQRLKCLQGIRFYGMILLIISHSRLSFYPMYYENTMEIEKETHKFFHIFHVEMFGVQIFFILSTMLVTIQILEIHQKNGRFTLYNCFVLYLNRVIRYFPTSLVGIFFVNVTRLAPVSPQIWDVISFQVENCRRNWWALLLQLNSLINVQNVCLMPTWYIGVDTVLYATTVLLLYASLKFNLNLKKIIAWSFFTFCAIFANIIYTNRLNQFYLFDLKIAIGHVFPIDFYKLYFTTWANFSTACVGMALGAIYFHTKEKKPKLASIHPIVWFLPFFVLPPLAVYLSSKEIESQLIRAVLGSFLKPIFATGIAVGILGLLYNLGGPIKKALEWNWVVKLGNVTYCVYVYHMFLVFTDKGADSFELLHFSVAKVIMFMVLDVVLSFPIGVFFTVTLEQPFLTLQKMYLPQVKTVKKDK